MLRRCCSRSGSLQRLRRKKHPSSPRYAELVDGGRLGPPIRTFRGENAPRYRRTAAIAEQGKAGRSRSRHSGRHGPRDPSQPLAHNGDSRSYAHRRLFEVVSARGKKIQDRRRIPSKRVERLGGRFKAGAGREPKRGKNLWRRRLDPGIDENHEQFWQRDQRTKSIANAGHHSRMRIKTDENVRSRRPCRSAHPWIVD